MEPISPIIPGYELPEIVYAANQPPYIPLPVFKHDDGTILSRWHMSWLDRLRVLWRGNIYLWVKTFNQPLQPVKLQVVRPEMPD